MPPPPAARLEDDPASENRRAIYEQDAEFVRHHDTIKWGRFQTVSVIEGAALYASFQVSDLSRTDRVLFMIAATIVIGFIFLLAIVDARATAAHLKRMRKFEISSRAKFPPSNFRPLFGFRTTRVGMGVIMAFNLVVVLRLAQWPGW